MRLNRKSSLVLAFLTIVLFFTIAHVTAPKKSSVADRISTKNAPLPESDPAATPEEKSQFELTHFQRSETRNGRKVWEVTADNGKYFPQLEITRLANVKVVSTRTEDSTFVVSAESADVKLTGTSLASADLKTDVVAVINDEVTVKTEEALYDYKNGSVVAPTHVQIAGPFYTSEGDSMEVDTEEETITLTGNVRTVINPVPKEKPEGDGS